ncbi:hypothetical protein HID58_070420 [Brassica napus]|uniref:Uncharacterized protein n=1 Tax=Brassica napus TaxID=3708 RepID=A0ABQ7YYS8_BRANA|nr:hypothetical protein HID58_070420 [Brassica napus]
MAFLIQLAHSASWTDPTRRMGELVGASGPTPPFGELDDGCFVVQDPFSEALSNISRGLILVGASGPTRPFGKLDDECFAVQDPLSEALSNLSRGLIV